MTAAAPAPRKHAAVLAAAVAELKPRMRGWLHAYAAFVSIVCGASLISISFAMRGPTAGVATTVYASTVTLLFGISALYHRLNWSPRARMLMKRADHSMIFVFIAGTYTPIIVLTLAHRAAVTILLVIWIGALVGVGLQAVWPTAPRWLSVPCYIALGWVAAFIFPEMINKAGVTAFVLIAFGGIVYTAGAVIYGLKKPNPFPGTFGFHEVFHACTLVAAASHYTAIWMCVFS